VDSFKRTLRRRLIWLFVIVAVVLLYADVSDAKGGGGHGGGHGGGGHSSSRSSSHTSSHSSSRSSSPTARTQVAQNTATKAAVAGVETVTLSNLSRGRVLNSGVHKTCVSRGSVAVVRYGGKIVKKCPK
jgi:hypothetical protein